MRRASTRLAVAVLVLGMALSGQATAKELRVCLLDDDLPRSKRGGGAAPGFDVELMGLLAERLEARLAVVWVPSAPPFSEIDDPELPVGPLARGECDVATSIPGVEALGPAESEARLTRAYYGAGFELVSKSPTSEITTLDQLAEATVAVRLQSLGHMVLQRRGYAWLARPTPTEVLDLLDRGDAAHALVWGPALATVDREPDPSWVPPTILRFNQHLAVREGSAISHGDLDRALAQLIDAGDVRRLAQSYGLDRPPFDSVFEREAFVAQFR